MRTLPKLHLIGPLDGVVSPEDFQRIAAEVGKTCECAVHVRMPGAPGGDVFDVARQLKLALLGSAAQIVVNDRVDVALAVNANGVQLGERSLPPQAVRRIVGSTKLIGRSVHDVAGAKEAVTGGADYLFAGHVFDTDSKTGEPGRGLEWLNEICMSVAVPVVAIGGISLDRVGDVIEAGAWGAAIGRDLLLAEEPAARAVALVGQMNERSANAAKYRKPDNDIAKWLAR